MNTKILVFTFESHYDAIKAKTFLSKSKAIEEGDKHFSLSPTPRLVSSTCATSLLGDEEAVLSIHKNKDIYTSLNGIEGVYILDGNNKEVIYER